MSTISAELQLKIGQFTAAASRVDSLIQRMGARTLWFNQIGHTLSNVFGPVMGAAAQFGAKMKGIFDLGGEVSDLSANTGMAASQVMVLRQAFANAGLGAEGMGGNIAKLQKALSGTNEEGQSTNAALQRLGLAAGQLDNLTAVEQIRRLQQAFATKRDVSAFLSCTIYDKQFTVVEWQEDGQWVRFLSTINFHYLRGLSGFETANSYYLFFMMPGDSSREEFEEWRQFLARNSFGFQPSPSWPLALLRQQKQTGKSAWQLLSAEPVSNEALRTIEDLHRYFDANREGLIRSYEEREAVRLAQEKWLQENPPTPKNTVVEFFPIRSSQAPDRLGRKSFNPSMPR